MRKLVLAVALLVASGGVALAAAFPNPFYVAIDRYTGRCVMMQFMGATGPDTRRYRIMGAYNNMRKAHRAMVSMGGACH